MRRQHLIFDADDTLWENNIYFDQAFERFCEFLDHSALTPGEVRAALDEIELANNKMHGYGTLNFGRNLVQCFERLAERAVDDEHRHHVASLAYGIFDSPMQLMPDVIGDYGVKDPFSATESIMPRWGAVGVKAPGRALPDSGRTRFALAHKAGRTRGTGRRASTKAANTGFVIGRRAR